MAELSVQISGDAKRLLSEIEKSEKGLKGLEKVSAKTGKNVGSFGGTAAKGINTFKKSAVNATPAVQEFSRVIQDAPFGIQGVGNNIQQLTANFGNLSNKAGGTKAALQAMLGTLSGPAGILLAVSAITSLLTVYSDELLNAAGSSSKLAKASKEYVGEAQAEIIALKQLIAIASDETNSKKVRQGAIDEINKDYSKYLGNLDLESIKTNKIKQSIDALTVSLIKQAKIKGIADIISEETKDTAEDLLNLELKREEATKRIASLTNSIENATSGKEKFISKRDLVGAQKALVDVNNEINKINKNSTESLKPFLELQKSLQKDVFAEGLGDGQLKAEKENISKINSLKIKSDKDYASEKKKLFDSLEAEYIKEQEQSRAEFVKGWENIDLDVDGFSGMAADIGRGFQNIQAIEGKIKDIGVLINSIGAEGFNLEGLNLEQLDILESKLENSIIQADIFSNAIGSAFNSLSNEISNSLQTGNAIIDAFTGAIINSLTQIGTAMLQQLILDKVIGAAKKSIDIGKANSNAIVIATNAAAAAGPLGAPLLPGLIASQLAIVNGAFAGISAFAKGGFSGDDNLAYLNKNELVLRPMEQAALYNAIRGNNMGGLASSTTRGLGSENIISETKLKGSDIVIVTKRANKKTSRRS